MCERNRTAERASVRTAVLGLTVNPYYTDNYILQAQRRGRLLACN